MTISNKTQKEGEHTKIAIVYDAKKSKAVKLAKLVKMEIESLGHEAYFGLSEEHLSFIDIIITLGGDGLVMNVANRVVNLKIPMLRINFGHVGFLANVEPEEAMEKIKEVIERKNYIIVKKTRLEVFVGNKNEADIKSNYHIRSTALNDVVIERDNTEIITATVRINGKKKKRKFRGDGLIVFTETGATAYNMSAGGRSIFKKNQLGIKVISPTAAAAPDQLRLQDDSDIEVEVIGGSAIIVIDGQKIAEMENNVALIRKSYDYTYFIEIGDVPKLEG